MITVIVVNCGNSLLRSWSGDREQLFLPGFLLKVKHVL